MGRYIGKDSAYPYSHTPVAFREVCERTHEDISPMPRDGYILHLRWSVVIGDPALHEPVSWDLDKRQFVTGKEASHTMARHDQNEYEKKGFHGDILSAREAPHSVTE